MLNIKYVALILVFSILCYEPTIAVQIGDLNSQNPNLIQDSNPNGTNIFSKNVVDQKLVSDLKKSKHYLKNNSSTNQTIKHTHPVKKSITPIPIHHLNIKIIRNNTQNSHQKTLNNTDYNNTESITEDKATNTTITDNVTNTTQDSTITDTFNNTTNVTANNVTNSTFNNTTNATVYNVTNTTTNNVTNGTFNNTSTTNTENKDVEESTKDKVHDTLLDAGYAFAVASAAIFVLFPDPCGKIVAAGCAVVACLCFVGAALVSWLW